MNDDLLRWQEYNEQYLAAALAWLRARLARLAEVNISDSPASTSMADRLFWRKAPTLDAGASVSNKEIERTTAAMAEAESTEPPPTLIILGKRLGLSRFEREVLLLCAAMELDTRIAALCARAQDDPHRPYPTFALAMALFDEPAWDVLSPERPLRHWRLIEINQPDNQPLTTSSLRADERIVNYLKGLNYLDDRLDPLLVPLDVSREADDLPALPPSQQATVDVITRYLEQPVTVSDSVVLQMLGPDSPSKQLVAWHAAASLGLHLYRLPAQLLPTQVTELETLIRLWQRESMLLPLMLYLDAHDLEDSVSSEGQISAINRFIARSHSLFFLDVRDIRPELGRPALSLDIAKPTPVEQQAAWGETLGADTSANPALLAGQFNLSLTTIHRIVQKTQAMASVNGHSEHQHLWTACLESTRPRLDILAQRLDPKATWGDIILPEEQRVLLHRIADQVAQRSRVYEDWGFRNKMNRGLGINALFSGVSGTGKTMAAEVIANDLHLNLYRIDLSAVVSKYIGETEKNLRRLFDAAEDGGAILFFDEADALFGKRSEVKDSHDRYANIEINYLLQRMEAYRGLAILATNMKSALDDAFVRRLRFIVDFPFPGVADRRRIWQRVFPSETPTANLDFDRLARLKLAGGSIHNIALNAAFLAAKADTSVTMPLILVAARAEFQKMEQPVNEADFRWEEPVVSSQ